MENENKEDSLLGEAGGQPKIEAEPDLVVEGPSMARQPFECAWKDKPWVQVVDEKSHGKAVQVDIRLTLG